MGSKRGTDISAAILAGGSAVRFGGRDKAFIQVHGESIIARMFSVVRPLFAEIIVVTGHPGAYAGLGPVNVIHDQIPGRGPLSGIHAALSAASADAVFVFACDLPFLQAPFILEETAEFQKQGCDILVPRHGPMIEPLHSVYACSIAPVLGAYLQTAEDRQIRSFFPRVTTRYMEVDAHPSALRSFVNVNSPKDLDLIDKV